MFLKAKNMKSKKDKIIVKDSLTIGADAIVDAIAKSIPGINIAYNLGKALYGAGMKMRQEKVVEWVEMIKENPGIFTEKIVSDPAFQDGFVYSLEKYIIERNESKRFIFKNIFLGFTKSNNKIIFSLEKFVHTLSQLSEMDIKILKDVDPNQKNPNYQIYGANNRFKENIINLINEGLLLDTTGTRWGNDSNNSPFVQLSQYGRKFIEFIKQ